ncbi:uncharacterized protein LOC124355381 isoform X1 [Homalodisca vitripennis]|uniref:uncharacterized protein LOC124355381 isoform X1 n=1 Tax=Homalodisca vitripennis TaxID=197043 RepID=UPI001EEB93FE|nr:uncharacterized protein LOC124355381 isoform X1 [Homalodisca vitripennis]
MGIDPAEFDSSHFLHHDVLLLPALHGSCSYAPNLLQMLHRAKSYGWNGFHMMMKMNLWETMMKMMMTKTKRRRRA